MERLLQGTHYERMKRLDTLDKDDMMKDLKQKHLPKNKKTLYQKLSENLKSGVVVGMVNLPMCISFAVASGSTPEAGVLSGIWGGVFGGLIGGSYYNILGPAGGLISFVAKFCSKWGPDALPWCTIFSGLFTFLILIFNLGKYIDVFPGSVNEGFTLGVAFAIFFGQVGNAFGIPPQPLHHSNEEESILVSIVKSFSHIDQMNTNAFALFIVFFLALFILSRAIPKIPWIVIVNILAIIIGYLDNTGVLEFNLVTLEKKFGNLKFTIAQLPKLPDDRPYLLVDPDFYVDSLPTAFVVVLECLISAKIADSVTNTKFHIQRELKGLYVTSLVIGATGGMPSTAALPRTALNIKSGATHKYSGLISSIVLFLLGLIFFPFFKYLPLSIIAAQMCYTAIRLVNFDEVGHMFRHDKPNFNLLIFVFLVGILTDPIIGIFLGLLIYQLLFSEMLLNPYSEVILTEDKVIQNEHHKTNKLAHFSDIPDKEGKYVIYRFVGVLSFMNIDIHKERIMSLAKNDDSIIVLSLRYMNITDVNALEALKQLIDEIENNDIKRKIPKNYQNEFMNDLGELELPDIETDETHLMKENLYLGKKIIISGLSRSKYAKLAQTDWIHKLRENGQLFISEDVVQNYDPSHLA